MKNAGLKVCTMVVCATTLLALTLRMPRVSPASNAQILIYPTSASAKIGENVTVTVNATNVDQLSTWEADLKFNGTIADCTSTWIPSDNVFTGHSSNPVGPEFGRDAVDGSNYVYYGNTLLGADNVSVVNGILYQANFTLEAAGTTTITIATTSNPVHVGAYSWETFHSLLQGPPPDSTSYPYTTSTGSTVKAIPEFPSLFILPLFFAATLVAVTAYRRKNLTLKEKTEKSTKSFSFARHVS